MPVNADGVVESLNVFEDKPIGMVMIFDPESVKPLTFDYGCGWFNSSCRGLCSGIRKGRAQYVVKEDAV
jgi:hypothetical protein